MNEKKCPFCAEQIKKEAIVCKHCQRDLPPETSATQPKAEKPKVIPAAIRGSSWGHKIWYSSLGIAFFAWILSNFFYSICEPVEGLLGWALLFAFIAAFIAKVRRHALLSLCLLMFLYFSAFSNEERLMPESVKQAKAAELAKSESEKEERRKESEKQRKEEEALEAERKQLEHDSYPPSIGEEGFINTNFVAGRSQRAFDEFMESGIKNDAIGRLELAVSGHLIAVPEQTKVLVLDRSKGVLPCLKIRLLSGQNIGEIVYIPNEVVVRKIH